MNKISLPREGGIIKKGATFLGAKFRIKESILVGGELGVPTNLNLTGAEIFLKLQLAGSFDTFVDLKSYYGITTTNALEGEFQINKIQSLSWQPGVWSGIIEIKFVDGDRIPYINVEITVS
jgi:hypothetical protein